MTARGDAGSIPRIAAGHQHTYLGADLSDQFSTDRRPGPPPAHRLHDLIPDPDYAIEDSRMIRARPDDAWDRLLSASMRSLPIGYALDVIRHGPAAFAGREPWILPRATFLDVTPIPVIISARPKIVVSAGAVRPWRVFGDTETPPLIPIDELPTWRVPGWVLVGMEFVFEAAEHDRTLVSVRTVIRLGDEAARRRFAPYWKLIKPASWLIRREVLLHLGRAHPRSEPEQ